MTALLDFFTGTRAGTTIQQLGHPAAGVIGWLGGSASGSGVVVNDETAMTYSAVWCATRVICETVARLPLLVYQYQKGGGKERATGHALFRLLHDEPNHAMTSMHFREVMTERAVNAGWAYAEIERDGNGTPLALWPIHPYNVRRKEMPDGETYYLVYSPSKGGWHSLTRRDVFELCGPLGGKGVIPYAKESIGLGLATEQYGASFFGKGAVPLVVLEHPGHLPPEARANLRREWNEVHGGPNNGHETAVLWEGMKVNTLTINNEQGQFLETRQFNLAEIARWYNITPHKLHDLLRATFSNVEHLGIDFVTSTVAPWCIRWEQAIDKQLIDEEDHFAEHVLEQLLRGDILTRYQAYSIAVQNGWMNRNQVCALENQNPIGPEGEIYTIQLNMQELGSPLGAEQQQVANEVRKLARILRRNERSADVVTVPALIETKSPPNEKALEAMKAVVADVMNRMLTKEANAAKRAAKKPGGWIAWLEEFYGEHQATLAAALAAPVAAWVAVGGEPRDAGEVAARHCGESREALLSVADGPADGFEQRVVTLVDTWHSTRKEAV